MKVAVLFSVVENYQIAAYMILGREKLKEKRDVVRGWIGRRGGPWNTTAAK